MGHRGGKLKLDFARLTDLYALDFLPSEEMPELAAEVLWREP
jgi:hypothetical protein